MPRLDEKVRASGIYVAELKYGGASVPNSEFVVEKTASPLNIDLKSDGGYRFWNRSGHHAAASIPVRDSRSTPGSGPQK
jgi:hypothetical protein